MLVREKKRFSAVNKGATIEYAGHTMIKEDSHLAIENNAKPWLLYPADIVTQVYEQDEEDNFYNNYL